MVGNGRAVLWGVYSGRLQVGGNSGWRGKAGGAHACGRWPTKREYGHIMSRDGWVRQTALGTSQPYPGNKIQETGGTQ